MSVLVPSAVGVVQGDFLSAPRLNRMLMHVMKGVDMPTYAPKYDGMHVWCSEDTPGGSGFIRGTAYVWDGLLGQYLGSSGGRHRHDADSEAAGGLYVDILRSNIGKYLIEDLMEPTIGQFHIVKSGSAVESNDTVSGRIRLNTGGVNASTVNASRSGLSLDLARPIEFAFKGYVNANTFLSTRMGVAMESVTEGPSDLAKFGLEGCSSTATGVNWDVISATDALSSRSVWTSPETIIRGGPQFYRLAFIPGQSVTFAVNGSVPIVTKNTNIPAGGRTSHHRTFTAGIKTNDTTAKSLFMYGGRVVGTINDLSWF